MQVRRKVRDMMWEFPHFFAECPGWFHISVPEIGSQPVIPPSSGDFTLFFFPSVFFYLSFTFSFLLPVQGKVRGLLVQLLCWKLRTRSLFLVLLLVGKWRMICGPLIIQNSELARIPCGSALVPGPSRLSQRWRVRTSSLVWWWDGK